MRKRNKESEEKKWWILQAVRYANRPKSKEPVLSQGIFLRDITYTVDNENGCKYGYPGGWDKMIEDMTPTSKLILSPQAKENASKFIGFKIRDSDGNIVTGPVEFWGGKKKGYSRYWSTIDSRRRSWPMYQVQNGKFVDYEWPKKAKLDKSRTKNRNKYDRK